MTAQSSIRDGPPIGHLLSLVLSEDFAAVLAGRACVMLWRVRTVVGLEGPRLLCRAASPPVHYGKAS